MHLLWSINDPTVPDDKAHLLIRLLGRQLGLDGPLDLHHAMQRDPHQLLYKPLPLLDIPARMVLGVDD
jgi:hypothetical protein